MTIGKKLLLYSASDPGAQELTRATSSWGCMAYTCSSRDHLRGNLEGANYDLVLCQPSSVLRDLIAENSHEDTVRLPLAEVEKRHIMRVLSSTGGNKTRAARILGIDTKTLYNKLKIYRASEEMARRRMGEMGDQSGAMGA